MGCTDRGLNGADGSVCARRRAPRIRNRWPVDLFDWGWCWRWSRSILTNFPWSSATPCGWWYWTLKIICCSSGHGNPRIRNSASGGNSQGEGSSRERRTARRDMSAAGQNEATVLGRSYR